MNNDNTIEALNIEPTQNTPEVSFDATRGRFEIKGRSLPEHAIEFYEPILEWIERYVRKPKDETLVLMDIDYFNTPSAKPLLDILKSVDRLTQNGYKLSVQWHYRNDDEDMKETGSEYAKLIQTPVELIGH